MSKEFKVGDKVYYLSAKPQIYILEDNIDNEMYPLAIEDTLFRESFTRIGLSYISDSLPSIFHATEENRRKLSELYGVEFEAPPVKPTSKESTGVFNMDNKHIFTFGMGQVHEGCYHVIEASSIEQARAEMFRRFDDNWSMHYCPPNAAEKAGVERFNLKEIV